MTDLSVGQNLSLMHVDTTPPEKNDVNNRIVIYTAIFNDYDRLREPHHAGHNCDFVCFTDDPSLRSDRWDVRYIDLGGESGHRANRHRKMLPHLYFPIHDISVYLDGNIRVLADLTPFALNALRRYPIAIPHHPDRDDLYDELSSCLASGLIGSEKAEQWLARYREDAIPRHCGLFENNLIVRRHKDSAVIRLMEKWWNVYDTYGGRDQLSLVYLARRQGLAIEPITCGPRTSRRYFAIYGHEGPVKRGPLVCLSNYIWANKNRTMFYKSYCKMSEITQPLRSAFKRARV